MTEQQDEPYVQELVTYQAVCPGPHLISGTWSSRNLYTSKRDAEKELNAHQETEHPRHD